MTRVRPLAACAACAGIGFAGYVLAAPTPIEQPTPAPGRIEMAAPTAPLRTVEHTVIEGDTAGSVLRDLGAPAEELLAGAGAGLNRLSVGDRILLDYRGEETRPFRLRLQHDPAVTTELAWNGKRYVSRQIPVPYTVADTTRAITVDSSLWQAAIDAGFTPGQVISLAKIFEYDVDFNTELYAGARFRLVLDRLTDDAGKESFGDIRAAILDNGGKSYTAIRYRLADGTVGWFDKEGKGRRKAFLRSPIEFSRVTSGFTAGRYHPILHKMRAHKGVDLAAPSGTPIRAVADGVVARAGWAGGHGNHIELRHDNGYSTAYSHLSSMGVKAGQRVRQGETIGRVGSTGLSTGPHLHYEFMVNGVHRDPMSTIVPITQPLPEAEKAAFFAVRDAILPRLEDAAEIGAAVAEENRTPTD